MNLARFIIHVALLTLVISGQAAAQMPTSVKNLVIRAENPRGAKERLILPYAFASETMGLTAGIGAMAKGYGQDQVMVAATVFASSDELEGKDDAAGVIAGIWDLRVAAVERLFATATGSFGYYPRKRAYSAPIFSLEGPRPGSNDSRADQFIEIGGHDHWADLRLEYVLPMGAARHQSLMTYHLKEGLLTSSPSGGSQWHPFRSGVTHILLKQYYRHQSFEFEPGDLRSTTAPLQLALSHDNTDFPINPSLGSRQFIGITHDFGWLGSDGTWSFWEVEAAKFFSLGENNWSSQQVLALDLWTGDTPSWSETLLPNGTVKVDHAPPYTDGATLGGFYRFRAYPFYRFNDRSVIYTSAEYRTTLRWNPIARIRWLRFLKMDWWQLVGFIEGGRVAGTYSLSSLTSDWKVDLGIGIRAMLAGGIVRLDMAASNEGANFWFMIGQPF